MIIIGGILVNTAVMTTVVMLIIGVSSVLSFTGLPSAISKMALVITDNKYILLLIMNVFLLVVGTFMDMASALLIFTLIFLPIVRSFGMTPVQFGVMIVFNLAVGTVTPPVGNVLFVGCSLAKLKLEVVLKSLMPFFIAIFIEFLINWFKRNISQGLPSRNINTTTPLLTLVGLNENEMWIDTLFMTVLFFHSWGFNRMDNFGGVFGAGVIAGSRLVFLTGPKCSGRVLIAA